MKLAIGIAGALVVAIAALVVLTWRAEYRGHLMLGFEMMCLVPCDDSKPDVPREECPYLATLGYQVWWVRLEEGGWADLRDRIDRALPQPERHAPYEQVYVRVRGRLSETGVYGHMGQYSRELTKTNVLEVRKPAAHDCD